MTTRTLLLTIILTVALVTVACGGGETSPATVDPVAPSTDMAAPSAGTAATQPPAPPATDTPAALTEPPTPTPLPAPAVVLDGDGDAGTDPTPTVVAEDSAENAAAPLPGQIGPDFPAGVNPFTGETVDPTVLNRRPVAVKVSNYPPLVRPQSGLNNADIVFEHYAEGGATRFTALFYGKDADQIGSIRSGRLIDLEIPKMYDAAFAYSGASGPVRLKFRDSPFFDRIISPDFGHDGFYRVEDPNKAFEHTLFTDTFFLRNILDARGQNTPPTLQNGMVFNEALPDNGAAASTITVDYAATTAFWQYVPDANRYQRWTDGVQQVDASTGQPLSFRNVVVLGVNHVDTLIIEDSLGSPSIEIQAWGDGPVSVFRDGQRFDGRWQRLDPTHMLTFVDADGNPLPLGVGNTFVQVVPLGFAGLTVEQ